MENYNNLMTMKIKELRTEAKRLGIKNYQNDTKRQFIERIKHLTISLDQHILDDYNSSDSYLRKYNINPLEVEDSNKLINEIFQYRESKLTNKVIDKVKDKLKLERSIHKNEIIVNPQEDIIMERTIPNLGSEQHRGIMFQFRRDRKFYEDDMNSVFATVDIAEYIFDRVVETIYQFRKMTNHKIRFKMYQQCLKRYVSDNLKSGNKRERTETVMHIVARALRPSGQATLVHIRYGSASTARIARGEEGLRLVRVGDLEWNGFELGQWVSRLMTSLDGE